MLKALIKKQFLEIFRGYFINPKTNKARGKKSVAGYFVFFAFAMACVFVVFYGLASSLSVFIDGGLKWLYYALMGIFSTGLGVFGSVFNTYASLYLPKDNDLLLSMPIPPLTLLLSRMTVVVGLSFLYAGAVWLPAMICSYLHAVPTAAEVVSDLLLFVMLTLLVSALTCALGWVIAAVAGRIKKKSFIVVLITLVFLCGYYFVSFRLTALIENILSNGEAIGGQIRKWANLFYQFGMAASGRPLPMLIFSAVAVAAAALCLLVLSKSFISLTTRSAVSARKPGAKIKAVKSSGTRAALLKREAKRFASSPMYMLNCGLGVVIFPLAAAAFVIKRETVRSALAVFAQEFSQIAELLPLFVFVVAAIILSMNLVSAPSVSLEGKNLWILRVLPVSTKDILRAKLVFHLLVNAVPAVICVPFFCFGVGIDLLSSLAVILCMLAFTVLTGVFGLLVGIDKANVSWTSETVPLKGVIVFIVMLGNWLMTVASAALGWLAGRVMPMWVFLLVLTAVFAAVSAVLIRRLYGAGAEKFEAIAA